MTKLWLLGKLHKSFMHFPWKEKLYIFATSRRNDCTILTQTLPGATLVAADTAVSDSPMCQLPWRLSPPSLLSGGGNKAVQSFLFGSHHLVIHRSGYKLGIKIAGVGGGVPIAVTFETMTLLPRQGEQGWDCLRGEQRIQQRSWFPSPAVLSSDAGLFQSPEISPAGKGSPDSAKSSCSHEPPLFF